MLCACFSPWASSGRRKDMASHNGYRPHPTDRSSSLTWIEERGRVHGHTRLPTFYLICRNFWHICCIQFSGQRSRRQDRRVLGNQCGMVRMTTTAALELVQLTKKYGAVTAVDAINLKIPAGSYCCLLGPSGCGKTSTLRMVAGHESATSGDILVGPKNVTDLPPAERNTAMMFQSYALFPHLSVIDNVAFALKMKGIVKAERHAEAKKLLELVDMQAYAARLPAQLSGGQQQRVALARALITSPQILLLDEPL